MLSLFALKFICNTPKQKEIIFRQTELQRKLSEILDSLKKEPKAQIFLTKVSKKDAPDYYDVIKHPMDLGTIARKLHLYRDLESFKKDLDLIWSNCLTYNTASYFIDCANEMKMIADSLMQDRTRVEFEAPEDCFFLGLPPIDRKYEVEKIVVEFLKFIGFQKCEKTGIKILVDILEHKITNKLKEISQDL